MDEQARPDVTTWPRVELRGVPALWAVDGTRVVLERKSAALLALLAIDGTRSRADLAALLWPQSGGTQARNSLRQRLFKLQRAAGADVIVGGEELRLAPDLVHDLDEPGGLPDAERRAGGLLEGLDYDDTVALAAWVEEARSRLRWQRADRLAELASRHEAEQRIAPALAVAQRLLGEEPLLEHAHRRVMRLHYLRGDRAAALAAFEQCRQRLRDELGSTPDAETLALAALIGSGSVAAPVRALAPPLSVLRPPRLAGRSDERARLVSTLDARGVLVLHGPPGIGKTRLLEDVLEARPGVLRVGAQAGDERVPYAVLARLLGALHARAPVVLPPWACSELARLLPVLGPAPAARADALRLQQAWATALGVWSDAGVEGVLVDDLHHADEASLECLLAHVGAAPLAWVLTVRTHELPPLLQQWMQARAPDENGTLALPRLDESSVGSLLESLALPHFDAAAWRAALSRHTGGNPLFVLETVRALLALGDAAPRPDAVHLPVPAALDALIERRLGRLSERALRLARVAALAGADFDADVAAHVLEAHPLDMVEPWRELEDAQLLHDGRLAHDLIAEATARALPQGIAHALHARLAAALEALGRGPARVAPHWAAALAWPRAGETYAEAARLARRASRRADEVMLWERAAEGFDRAGLPARAFEARADSVEAVIIVHGVGHATALVDRLDAEQRTEPQRMRAHTARATVCLMAGDAGAGEAAARAALDAATRLDVFWPRFEAARLLAVALSQQGRPDEALASIEPLRERVLAEGDAEQRHRFWADLAYALKAAQRGSATAHALRQAIVSAQEAGDYAELATLTSNLALVEGNLGRVEHALDQARRARELADPLGDAVGPSIGAIEMYVANHETALGRYGEALASFARADACFGSDARTVWVSLAANHKAVLMIQLGQHARALQLLRHDAPVTPAVEARRLLLRARIDRQLQVREPHPLDAALKALGEWPDPMMRMLVALDAALELGAAQGVLACAAVRDEAESCELLAIGMRARVLGIECRLAAGALSADEVEATERRLGEVHAADTYAPHAWWIVSRAYRELGRPLDAQRTLRRAWAWIMDAALPRVPAVYRDGFLQRNPTNRAVLAEAGGQLGHEALATASPDRGRASRPAALDPEHRRETRRSVLSPNEAPRLRRRTTRR